MALLVDGYPQGERAQTSPLYSPQASHADSTQSLVSNAYSPQSVSSKSHSGPFESSDHSSQWIREAASSRSRSRLLDNSSVNVRPETRPPSMAETSTALPPYTPRDPSQQIQNSSLSPRGTNINHME
ncbi:hypothetical protein B0H19DRAFT_1162030 [Mycena capillaripes]|nr:hypothetical protein B0H19DRAFT_1162030 [Mycena capillaripes]